MISAVPLPVCEVEPSRTADLATVWAVTQAGIGPPTEVAMSVTEHVRQTAPTHGSSWTERLGRLGLVARGITYALIGVLALQMAFGDAAQAANQKGAFHAVASQPLGEVILWVIAIGLFGYAVWQLIGIGRAEDDKALKRWGKRVVHLMKAIVYLAFAWTAASIALSAGTTSTTSATSDIMKEDGGQLLIGLVGLVIVIVGFALFWKGWTTDFEKELRVEEMRPTTYSAIRALGRVGYVARGIVFALFGVLVIYAAVTFSPEAASGVDEALQEVAQAPAGPVLLTLVALGLIAFGAYSCAAAKYHRSDPS